MKHDLRFARQVVGGLRKESMLATCLCLFLFSLGAIGQQPQETQPQPGQEQTQSKPGQPATPAFALPARAPGYELYYSKEDRSIAFATRWGYFDGWRDGKHDSELGITKLPTDQDRYKLVPDHGLHPGIPRTEYKTAYRSAYLHGYDHASKTINGTDARMPSQR